jgi:hypothetical protein
MKSVSLTAPVNGGPVRVPIVPPVTPIKLPVCSIGCATVFGIAVKVGAKLIVVGVTVTPPVMLTVLPLMIVVAEADPAKAKHRTALTPSAGNADFTLNLLVDKPKPILSPPVRRCVGIFYASATLSETLVSIL